MVRRLLRAIGWSRFGGLMLVAALLALLIAEPPVVEIVRNQSFDYYQRVKPRDYTPLPVTIIDVDERSIQELGQWPWPRSQMAQLVDKITKSQAVVTGFDMVFAEADRLSPGAVAKDNPSLSPQIIAALNKLPSNDDVFAAAIANSRVVLGQTSVRLPKDRRLSAHEPATAQFALVGPDPTQFIHRFAYLVQNRQELEAAAAGRGLFSLLPELDGIYRRAPLVAIVQDKLRLALSVEMLRVATGGASFAVRSNKAGISELAIARQRIRTDQNGSVWPYYSESQPARYITAVDFLSDKHPPNRLKGHLVLVGTSATGLEDYRATPMGIHMPGVEIHAQVLENLLSNSMLIRPNYAVAVELSVVFILGILIVILVPYLGALWSVTFATILLSGYLGASWYAFATHKVLIDPSYPLLSGLALYIFMATANYIYEERQRRQIRSAFGQYVSPALVDQLSDEPAKLELGGETRELSVLFSDVRGFTAISESFKDNPEGLTKLMNSFLTELSEAVLDEGGTIDKFMGDAIMAFWNAPLGVEDHALRSCRAALAMISRVEALNLKFANAAKTAEEAGEEFGQLHTIKIGIGINTGMCVVGNMGSRNRFDYTALGDAVNIASRLEGQSKPYGISIVLGETTADQVIDAMALLEIDLIRVKGKHEPARIYGMFGVRSDFEDDEFSQFEKLNNSLLGSYRDQDWDAAIAALELMRESELSIRLDLEEYLFIYDTRITEFSLNPPGRNWDGVFSATSK